MSLKFNSFRAERYLRSRFVEGRLFLASEASDLQLEMIDKSRQMIKFALGNISIDDGWQVEVYKITTTITNIIGTTVFVDTSVLDLATIGDEVLKNNIRIENISSIDLGATSFNLPSIGSLVIGDTIELKVRRALLVNHGEAWFDGMPFLMQGGEDAQASGSNLGLGVTIPIGGGTANITTRDEPKGLGKLIVFSDGGTTTAGQYRIAISAREEIITNNEDPFLKNANIPESTGQKTRLVYRVNIVPEVEQDSSPIPYTDSTTDGNLVNDIVVTPTPSGEGSEASRVTIASSQEIDGRNIEINIRNTVGSNKLPAGTTEQAEFTNGKLIDSYGNEYHLNLITNATVSNQVTLRVDKAPGQVDPKIIDNLPYTIRKRDVFVTDDINGNPQGQIYFHIASATFNAGVGFTHASNLVDRRGRVVSKENFEEITNTKFDLRLVDGGVLSWEVVDTDVLAWTSPFSLINPHGPEQTIATSQVALIDDSSIVYFMDITNGGAIEKGNLNVTITGGSTVLATSGTPNLTDVSIGNIIKVGTEVRYVTAIDNISKLITINSSISSTGASTIYLDTYYQGFAPIKENTFTLASRRSGKVYFSNLELSSGETSNIGSSIPQALLDYIGTPAENTANPDYGTQQVTKVTTLDPAQISDSEYFFINTVNDGVKYYIWFDKSGSATDPTISGRVGAEVDISAAGDAIDVASALATVMDGLADFDASSALNVTTITHSFTGTSTPAYNVNLDKDFLVEVTNVGTPANITPGVSLTNAIIELDKTLQELNNIIEEPIYDEIIRFPTGLTALTDVVLPVNSRKSNAVQFYVADSGALEVFINSRYTTKDEEWLSVDKNTVKFSDALPNDTTIHFRLDSLGGASTVNIGTGGGGGGDAWSDPVDANIVPDVNNIRDLGSASKKFRDGYFAGKLTVDGVIDPTGLDLVPQATNPLGVGKKGIWINNSNHLVFEDGAAPTNIIQKIEDLITGTATVNISRIYTNSTGITIPIHTAVYSPAPNLIAPADGTDDGKSIVIGITTEEITTGTSGKVAIAGAVEGITGFTHNEYVYLALTPGEITDVKPTLGPFPVSFRVNLLGVIVDDVLLLQITPIGEL